MKRKISTSWMDFCPFVQLAPLLLSHEATKLSLGASPPSRRTPAIGVKIVPLVLSSSTPLMRLVISGLNECISCEVESKEQFPDEAAKPKPKYKHFYPVIWLTSND